MRDKGALVDLLIKKKLEKTRGHVGRGDIQLAGQPVFFWDLILFIYLIHG